MRKFDRAAGFQAPFFIDKITTIKAVINMDNSNEEL